MSDRDQARDLVRHLLLLAGLAPAASVDGGADDPSATPGPGRVRSCIDAGSEVIVGVSAPGERGLRVFARVPGASGAGRIEWSWWSAEARRETGAGWRRLYSGEPEGVWSEVAAIVDGDSVGGETLRRWHDRLGPRGRVYSVSAAGNSGPVWVGWQLDRGVRMDHALAACEVASTWPVFEEAVVSLLGYRPSTTGGPWSVSAALDGSRFRLGTTRWARLPEDDGKRRRLVALVDRLGGDRRFVEAAYKLVCAGADAGRRTRVGRAVELEFSTAGAQLGGPESVGAEFFLSVPGSAPSRERSES
jgi:hypothetical protein